MFHSGCLPGELSLDFLVHEPLLGDGPEALDNDDVRTLRQQFGGLGQHFGDASADLWRPVHSLELGVLLSEVDALRQRARVNQRFAVVFNRDSAQSGQGFAKRARHGCFFLIGCADDAPGEAQHSVAPANLFFGRAGAVPGVEPDTSMSFPSAFILAS